MYYEFAMIRNRSDNLSIIVIIAANEFETDVGEEDEKPIEG